MNTIYELLEKTKVVNVRRPSPTSQKVPSPGALRNSRLKVKADRMPFEVGVCLITLEAHRQLEKMRVTADHLLYKHLFPEYKTFADSVREDVAITCWEEIEHDFAIRPYDGSAPAENGITVATNSDRTVTIIKTFKERNM